MHCYQKMALCINSVSSFLHRICIRNYGKFSDAVTDIYSEINSEERYQEKNQISQVLCKYKEFIHCLRAANCSKLSVHLNLQCTATLTL